MQVHAPVINLDRPDSHYAAGDLCDIGSSLAPARNRSFWLCLFGIVLVAAAVRFYPLGEDEYWLDELHSLVNSAGERAPFEAFQYAEIFVNRPRVTDLDAVSSLGAVWRGMRHDTHPPLHFMLLNLWRRAIGDSETATRSLSAIFSVLALVPLALLLRQLQRPSAGLFAALLLGLAYGSIHMAQQNRQYSLALFFVACSYLALVAAEDSQRRASREASKSIRWARSGWLLYGITLSLSVMTHYFTIPALAGHAVYAAVRFRRRTLWAWLTMCALAASVVLLLWGQVFLAQQRMIHDQPWLTESGEGHALKSLLRLADLPVRLLFQFGPFHPGVTASIAGATALVALTVALLRCRSREGLLFVSWFAVPCAALLLADLATDKQTLNHIRYPIVAVGGLAGLVALTLGKLKRPIRLIAATGLAIGMFTTLTLPTTAHPDARVAVAHLRENLEPNDLLIFDAIGWPHDWVPQFFAPVEYYMGRLPNPALLLRDSPHGDLLDQVRQFRRIWVICARVSEAGKPVMPNPSPRTHQLAGQTSYIWQIGWVYLFTKVDS